MSLVAWLMLTPAEAAAKAPTVWAVLIGHDGGYDGHTVGTSQDDIQLVAEALRRRLGADVLAIESLFDGAGIGRTPTVANISRVLPDVLKKLSPEETLIVYYRGHILRDGNRKLYLAVDGTRTSDLAATRRSSISFAPGWTGQAADVVLAVDADHAGVFPLDQTHIEYLGSSREKQFARLTSDINRLKSDNRHGLFTHWLCRGLEGAGDTNFDGVISFAELHAFVSNALKRSEGKAEQTVVHHPAGEEFEGMLRLSADSVHSAHDRIADLLDEQARLDGASQVCVQYFQNEFGGVRPYDVSAGAEVRRDLANHSNRRGHYLVEGAYDSGPDVAMTYDPSVSHWVLGRYKVMEKRDLMLLQCSLVRNIGDRSKVFTATKVIALDPNLKPMLIQPDRAAHQSFEFKFVREDGKTNVKIVTKEPVSMPQESVEFRIVHGDGQKDFELTPAAGNPGVLTLTPPAVATPYQIRVTNTTTERIYFRLLIDGINSLVQNPNDKELSAVLLDQARGYVLEPGKPYAFGTWIRNEGKGDQNRAFEFGPEEKAVATRLRKPADMGTIIMAFYREVTGQSQGTKGRVLTIEGGFVVQDILAARPITFVPEPMATVTVRYSRGSDPRR